MNPYIFFLDIDGTLASGGEVPVENVQAIREAQEKGHYVFINTGRSFSHIADEVKFAASYDGFVCGLGADIRFHGKQLFSQIISFEALEQLTEVALQFSESFIFEGEEAIYFTGETFSPHGGIKITSAEDWKNKYQDARISKITRTVIEPEPFEAFTDILVPYVHSTYAEYAQVGITKATAMHITAEKLGVEKARCVAIGDSANDMEMLSAAGIAVVMGNGTDDVKAIADFITDTAEQAGVAKAIRKLIQE